MSKTDAALVGIIFIGAIILIWLLSRIDRGVKTIDDVDYQTKVECRRYADNHPERSIPLERQRWFDEQGYDYINYDYYTDCLQQKVPLDGLY